MLHGVKSELARIWTEECLAVLDYARSSRCDVLSLTTGTGRRVELRDVPGSSAGHPGPLRNLFHSLSLSSSRSGLRSGRLSFRYRVDFQTHWRFGDGIEAHEWSYEWAVIMIPFGLPIPRLRSAREATEPSEWC